MSEIGPLLKMSEIGLLLIVFPGSLLLMVPVVVMGSIAAHGARVVLKAPPQWSLYGLVVGAGLVVFCILLIAVEISSGGVLITASLIVLAFSVFLRLDSGSGSIPSRVLPMVAFASVLAAVPFLEGAIAAAGFPIHSFLSINPIGTWLSMNFGGPYAHAFDILRWELGWIAFKTYSVVALIYGLLTVGGTLGIFVLLQVADRRQALLVVGGTTVGPVLGGLLLGERYDASPVIAGAVAVIVASAGLTTLVATLWPSAFALQKAMALPEGGAVSVSSEAGTTLPEPQNRVMEYIRSHNFAVSQSQMANDLGYSTEEVDRALQWLGDQNFLR